ncbi:MAG: FG-GAP-like repeat-containing protein [Patescibacteria group bacterium]
MIKTKTILSALIFSVGFLLLCGFFVHAQAAITKMEESWSSSGDDQASALYGFTTATAGDVNGDGYDDVIVGAQGYNSNTGKVYLYLGSANGVSTEADWTSTGDNTTGDNYGVRVAGAGDVNGDGYDDVIVGAEGANGHAGKAFVYHGSASGLSSFANWTYTESQANAFLGFSVASAGDVTGDGYDDVIVGAYKYDATNADAGRVYLFLGSASGLSGTASWQSSGDDQAGAWYGRRVMSAGDVNGDSYDDVLVGADQYDASGTDTGKAYLYYGGVAGLSVLAVWISSGDDQAGARFGMSVWGEDINNDGYSDIIIGAHQYTTSNSQAGKVYLYLGNATWPASTPTWTSSGDDQAGAWYGFSAPTVGDVNGDGYKDVFVGAVRYDNSAGVNTGKSYLYLGNANSLSSSIEWAVEGDQANSDPNGGERLGISTAGAGDVNGDGKDEILIGSEGYNTSAGRAWVYTNNAIFSISINSGAQYANSQTVTITSSASTSSDPAQMMVSENSDFASSSWESYSADKSFTLSSGDGEKTVYVKFGDGSGGQTQAVSNSIILDTTAPSTSVAPRAARYKNIQTVTLTSQDSGSGVDKIYYTTNTKTPLGFFKVYTKPFKLSQDTTLRYFAQDEAGNQEQVKTKKYIIKSAKFVFNKAKKYQIKIKKKNKKYSANDFTFLFKKLPKFLKEPKYYLEIQRFKKYPQDYQNAKQSILKKYWQVKTNLNEYQSENKKNNFKINFVFKYTNKELKALKRKNKNLKEKNLVLKYYYPQKKAWYKAVAKHNKKKNIFTITIFSFNFQNNLFTIGQK